MPGTVFEVVFLATISDSLPRQQPDFNHSSKDTFIASIDSNVEVSADLRRFASIEGSKLKFHLMPPGFVCVIKTK